MSLPKISNGRSRRIGERKRTEWLYAAEMETLRMITQGATLTDRRLVGRRDATVRRACGIGEAVISASAPCAVVNECFGATSEQRRPNTTENRASSSTRRRSQALRNRTLYGLQNLDPRFKSGRRLQIHSEICSVLRPLGIFASNRWTHLDPNSSCVVDCARRNPLRREVF